MAKNDGLIGISISLIAFIIYLITLCPTVYVGDSGELTAAAYTLGIAHPPGYPLLCLIGKIFTWIPLGNIALRINLLSAFFAAGSILILYLLLVRITRNRFTASAGSLALAFSHTLWNNANVGKSSYAINTFFICLILFSLYRWTETKLEWQKENKAPDEYSRRFLYLSGLFFGFGLANHHTILLLFPLYLGYIIYIQIRTRVRKPQAERKNKSQKIKSNQQQVKPHKLQFNLSVYINLFFFFILGSLVYLYLPIRAQNNPPINWGIPDSWERFLAHLTRKQYGSMSFNFSMPRTADLLVNQVLIYCKLLIAQFTPFLLIFVPFGIYALHRKHKTNKKTDSDDSRALLSMPAFSWLLLGIFIVYSLGLILLINYRLTTEEITLAHVFFIPAYVITAIWIAVGLHYFIFLITQYKNQFTRYANWLIIFLPLLPLLANYSNNNRRGTKFGYEYAQNILDSLPPNAILFSIRDSNNFTLAYQIFVEKQRSDITIYDMSGGLFADASGGYRKDKWRLSEAEQADYRTQFFNQLLAQNQNQRSIFFEIPIETTPFPGYILKHDAYFYRFSTASDTIQKVYPPSQKYNLDKYFNPRKMDSLASRISDFYIREALVDYHFQLGRYYQELGNLDTALYYYTNAEKIGDDFSQVHNNLGIVYYTLGKFDLALKEYEQAIAIEPNNREVYYNIALYYQNISKNQALAQLYYQRFQSLTK